MFISNFYGFLLDEFGMLSRRAGFSATAELTCKLGNKVCDIFELQFSLYHIFIDYAAIYCD